MSKRIVTRPRIFAATTTTKMLIGLTLFYFIGKTLSNR